MPPVTKDCHTCNRRRIRCDRTAPRCKKCTQKGLVCPGFGTRLRWTIATANHGVLQVLEKSRSSRKVPGQVQRAYGEDKYVEPALEPPNEDSILLKTQLPPISAPHPFFAHYTGSIATMMVWIDSEDNEYRRTVIPLAKTHETLKFAILAIAAAHASDLLPSGMEISQAASETALLMITERIRTMTGGVLIRNCNELEAFIAAALILSNYALLRSRLALALIHFSAVQIMIRTATLTAISNNNLFIFLKNQAAAFDVLACTAIFDSDRIESAILPELQCDSVVFGRFLVAIHGITMRSLLDEATTSDLASTTTLRELEDQFELARASALLEAAAAAASSSSSNTCTSRPIGGDVVRMVQAFHHAGVLYAHLRLEGFSDCISENYHISRLFHTLDSFEDFHATAHNLVWPLFIAGICCWPNVERMRTVSRLLTIVVETTRFGHYNNILRFHQELWESPHHQWIALARDWESRGMLVIPV